jgi:hypothetical protein
LLSFSALSPSGIVPIATACDIRGTQPVANLILLRLQSQWDKPADVDLPPESLTAAPDQITLPDNIYDDVFAGAGLSMDLCAVSSPGCPDLVVQCGRQSNACHS